MKNFIILVITCIYVKPVLAQDLPLFQSDEPLELTLEADVIALTEDKSDDPEYTQAFLIQNLPDYKIIGFEIQVKPRGNSRRLTDLCDFPPLKFNFKKNQLNSTVFEGQDKLKFVSQCRQLSDFKNYVLEEYLLYNSKSVGCPKRTLRPLIRNSKLT